MRVRVCSRAGSAGAGVRAGWAACTAPSSSPHRRASWPRWTPGGDHPDATPGPQPRCPFPAARGWRASPRRTARCHRSCTPCPENLVAAGEPAEAAAWFHAGSSAPDSTRPVHGPDGRRRGRSCASGSAGRCTTGRPVTGLAVAGRRPRRCSGDRAAGTTTTIDRPCTAWARSLRARPE
ncbi:hypothetical protein HBB16_06045 [Pseudonocardia sp. MCCB 268]|nr:hypothetical protein [Pseudonocardia cytotoxica]